MKKTKVLFLTFLILILLNSIVFSENTGDVYVIPIKGEINRATYNF
ncbi:MAG: nodulation protein NfeD, partial [Tissierellia bacterium]|nr:nodulation protein NfeD [Tissierellia bacterium]